MLSINLKGRKKRREGGREGRSLGGRERERKGRNKRGEQKEFSH
jgi:hypothetical protein